MLLENEKGIYGDTAQRVSDLLESVDSPALAHAFDPANYVEVGQDIDQAWSLLHARVRHFHVKDYNAKTHRNVPAGAGDGQIPSLMERAVEGGYDGFVVLEPHLVVAELSFGFTGPERFADAAKALKNILDQLRDRLRLNPRNDLSLFANTTSRWFDPPALSVGRPPGELNGQAGLVILVVLGIWIGREGEKEAAASL